MNLEKTLLITILSFILFVGCKQNQGNPVPKEKENTEIDEALQQTAVFQANNTWKNYVNQRSDSISNVYTENAIKIFADGKTLSGKQAIQDYILENSAKVRSIQSDTVIMANSERRLEYEVNGYTTNENVAYKQIVIWETKDGEAKRVFEVSVPIDSFSDDLQTVAERRKRWIELCNKNNASDLINEMYSENNLYFNHKPLITGREQLIEEYAYMDRENYSLTLNPIIVEQVTQRIVFEIGQCKGSYNGKYIIIWRKEKSGNWEVFIDSNI